MREIKLRIRLKSNYKDEYCTLYNSVFDKNIGIAFYPINKDEWDILSVDEYTGINDCKGKELYENDKIKINGNIAIIESKEYLHQSLGYRDHKEHRNCSEINLTIYKFEKQIEYAGDIYETH